MNAADKINIYSLREEAKKSEDNEVFKVLKKISNCRLGIGARFESSKKHTFFIDVLINLCTSHDPVDLNLMERKVLLLRLLKQRKYILNCEEDNCVSCELTVQSKNLIAECQATSLMMEKYMKTRNGQSLRNNSIIEKEVISNENR